MAGRRNYIVTTVFVGQHGRRIFTQRKKSILTQKTSVMDAAGDCELLMASTGLAMTDQSWSALLINTANTQIKSRQGSCIALLFCASAMLFCAILFSTNQESP